MHPKHLRNSVAWEQAIPRVLPIACCLCTAHPGAPENDPHAQRGAPRVGPIRLCTTFAGALSPCHFSRKHGQRPRSPLSPQVPGAILVSAYPPGAHYTRHLDNYGSDNRRALTLLLYANPNPGAPTAHCSLLTPHIVHNWLHVAHCLYDQLTEA